MEWKMYEPKIANAWYFNNWISHISSGIIIFHVWICVYEVFSSIFYIFYLIEYGMCIKTFFVVFRIFFEALPRLEFQHISGRIHIESI